MQIIEERVDRLEIVMERFVNEMRIFKDEMKEFKDEMKEFKDEMKEFKDGTIKWREELDRERKEMKRQWGDLARKMGTIVEDLIAPALRPVLSKYFNCETKMEGQRMRKRVKGEEYEVDAIALCDDKVFMIEARSTPKVEYADEIVEKSKRFFEFFPEYSDKRLIIIFGGVVFAENVIKYATKNKVYVMAYREWEYMDILNFDEIQL